MPGEDIAAENRREAAARKVARRAVPRISQKRRNLGIMYGLCGLFSAPVAVVFSCCFPISVRREKLALPNRRPNEQP